MNWPLNRLSFNRWQQLIVALVVLLQLIPHGAAKKCYVCDSSDNPSCADLKTNSSIVAEECTLDKMKSLDTWLFDLNKFSYFDTGTNKAPLMNCQKVVAVDPKTQRPVTARFCQLDTGDSDACAILRNKLQMSSHPNARRSENDGTEEPSEEFHCSICTDDFCNGGNRNSGMDTILTTIFILFTTMLAAVVENRW